MNKSKGPGPGRKKWGCRSRVKVIWGSIFTECLSLGEKPHLPQLSQSNLCLSKDTGRLDILAFLLIPTGYPLIWLGHMKACREASRPIWHSCPLSAAERASLAGTGFTETFPVMCRPGQEPRQPFSPLGKGWPRAGAKAKRYLLRVLPGTALFASNSTQAHKTYFCPVPLEHRQLVGNLSGLLGQIKVRTERKGRIQESSWRKVWVCGDWRDVGAKEAKGLQVSSRIRAFSLCGLGMVITW